MEKKQYTQEEREAVKQRLSQWVKEYSVGKQATDAELEKTRQKVNELPKIVSDLDEEFEKLTSITKKDWTFLVFASTLQVSRQLITSKIKTRLTDKESAKKTPFHSEEHSDRRTRKYYATKEEIVSNPVPFDAIRKTETVKNNGNPKLNGFNHRYTAIGHDPLLGLIFGTANIMTKTITVAKGGFTFDTYHVGSGIASNGFSEFKVDMLTNQASTSLMFEHIYSRIKFEGKDGWETVCYAIGKELVHLMSDVRTSKSLPLPIISAISPDVSRILNLCGIDALSVTTLTIDLFVSKFINMIIAYAHALCYNPATDGPIETYEVRTKNIIYYSSMISLTSTTVQTIYRAYMGDVSAISKFDFGGTINALKIIWETPQIISDNKSEYIRNKVVQHLK